MSTLNPTKKISRRQELRQDQVVTFWAKAWGYYDEHQQQVWMAAAGLVVILLALAAYAYTQGEKQGEAEAAMSPAVRMYEQGNYRLALDGVAGNLGLLAVVDEYGSTTAGNLARFYAADALYRLGEYDAALTQFESFKKENNYIGASALAGEASIHEIKGNFDRAGDLFREAAALFQSDVTSPLYLLNAGRAYEEGGSLSKAESAYMMVKDDYPESEAGRNIDIYLARIKALTSKG